MTSFAASISHDGMAVPIKVLVVGGGCAGLTAASRISECHLGVDVILVEASDRLGLGKFNFLIQHYGLLAFGQKGATIYLSDDALVYIAAASP